MRGRPGATKLRRALRRLRSALSAPSQPPAHAQPTSAWERGTDQRLADIEHTLHNQNRLLLISLVTVALDLVLKIASAAP